MEKATLEMQVSANDIGSLLTIKFDGQDVWQGDPGSETTLVKYDFDDEQERECTVSMTMSGKNESHVQFTESGEFSKDLLVAVAGIKLDGININQIVYDTAVYNHDFNGSKDPVQDRFFGLMGCNGTVTFKFKTPVFHWFLEHA